MRFFILIPFRDHLVEARKKGDNGRTTDATHFHRIVRLKTAGRLATGVCIVAIAILSLLPAEKIVRTGLGGHIEHTLAYLGMASIAAMAYSTRGIAPILVALLAYAGALEFLQRFSPGRSSSFEDFMFSAAGVVIGIAAFALFRKVSRASNGPGHQGRPRLGFRERVDRRFFGCGHSAPATPATMAS